MSDWTSRMPVGGPAGRPVPAGQRRDIELFTELSGDRNPLHYDEELAAATALRRHRRPGRRDTAILNAVVAEDLPGPGSVFLELNLRFPPRSGPAMSSPAGRGDLGAVGQTDHRAGCQVTRDDGVVAIDGTACATRSDGPWRGAVSSLSRSVDAGAVAGARRANSTCSRPRWTAPRPGEARWC